MGGKELVKMLVETGNGRNSRVIPWWKEYLEDEDQEDENQDYYNDINDGDDDEDEDQGNSRKRYYTEEEIAGVEECAAALGKEGLSAPVGEGGYTLFHLLVRHNFYRAVEKALEDGVDVNLTDGEGRLVTPLHVACCFANLAMVKLLLGQGADASLCDAHGRNAFHYLAHPNVEGICFDKDYGKTLDQRRAVAELLPGDVDQKDENGVPPLVYLIDGGCSEICSVLVDTFLDRGADPYFTGQDGSTLLLIALFRRRATAALRMMEYKDLVNRANKRGRLPMVVAEEDRQEGLCIALKDHGAEQPSDLTQVDTMNLCRIIGNAFTYAFRREELDMASVGMYLTEKLLEKAEDEEDYGCLEGILDDALIDKKLRVLDLFHEKGIDFTEPYYEGEDSVSCLRDKCMEYGHDVAVVKKLFDLGVDMERAVIQGRTPVSILSWCRKESPDAFWLFSRETMEQLDNSGQAAVHYVAKEGWTEALEVMLEKGVDVNLTQDEPAEAGNTPLHVACTYGQAETARVLIGAGADDRLQNTQGETPAHCLVTESRLYSQDDAQESEELLRELAHVDIPRNDGMTPLLLLLSRRGSGALREGILEILLEKGVDVNRRDERGNTALTLCAQNFSGDKKLLKMLVDGGADLNMPDGEGNTALYHALDWGSQDTARYLLKKGADYNRRNKYGESPAEIAAEKGFDILLELMPDIH